MTKTSIKKLFFIALISILFSSCSTSFYQVYEAKPDASLQTTDQGLVYEDEFCRISYNLWADQGDIGFLFYNKTDENIYMDLTESFFIANGIAHNYYRNRTFSSSKSIASSVSTGAAASQAIAGFNVFGLLQSNEVQGSKNVSTSGTSGTSVSFTEEAIITIPPKTAKVISEYNINSTIYRDCDLYKYPNNNQVHTVRFQKENSPLVFGNRIAYSKGEETTLTRIENEFYVNAITNYPEKQAIESRTDEFCGQKDRYPTEYFKHVAPNNFYLPYTKKKNDAKKH